MRGAVAAAIVAGALLVSAGVAPLPAQTTTAPVTVAWVDVPIADALERLATAGPMNLVWDAAALRSARQARVSCRLTDVLPEQVLGCITREAGLDWYRLSSGTYVVIGRAEAAPGYGALAGYVVDGSTGAPIPTARVWLAEAPPPRSVGTDGGFTIDRLLPGRYELLVHAIGYRPSRQRVELQRDARERARVVLEPIAESVLPIVVNGVRAGTVSGALGAAAVGDSGVAATLSSPSFFLPGAAQPLGVTRRDGTGDLHLQGGEIGEHPWRLDGVPLFDAAALSGLLGAVAPLAVDQLVIRRAGFRARDGSFAAGAIDLTHGLGDDRAPRSGVTVASDPLAVSARLQSPLQLGRARGVGTLTVREGTWGLTAPAALTSAIRAWNAPDAVLLQRLSGFGALPGLSTLDAGGFTPGGRESVALRDVHAAGRLTWRSLVSVDASFFRTAHAMSWAGSATDTAARTLATRDAYAWRTTGGQIGHRTLLGTRVRQHLQARAVVHSLSHDAAMTMTMPSAPGVEATMTGTEGNRVEEVGLRAEWTAAGASGWELTAGVDGAQTRASVDLANRVLRPLAASGRVGRLAAWGDATWPVGGDVFVETGLRVTQLETGRTYAEPRLALRREGGSDTPWAWRVAGGGYHQFVSQFDIATTAPMAFVPSIRFWLPMDGRGPVATAWHASAEAVVRPWARWELRAEGYARWQPVIPTIDYGALFDVGSAAPPVATMDAFVRSARGRALGAGLRALRDGPLWSVPMRVELSYDLGAAQRSFPSRFGGREQPVPWLEPQRAQLAIDARPIRGLVAALRARGVFGRPWALRQAYYDLFGAAPQGAGLPIDDPGTMRRPALYDLDLGVTYERRVVGARLTVGASVTNVLNRANVLDFGLVRDASAASPAYRMVPRLLPGRMPSVTLRITP